MKSIFIAAGLLGAVCVFAHALGGASAQTRCMEGKTASGDCVDAGLADSMRQTAVLFSQQKLSYTAYPILPTGDRLYRYPNELIPDPLKPASTLASSCRTLHVVAGPPVVIC
jgi:hypothetical protein